MRSCIMSVSGVLTLGVWIKETHHRHYEGGAHAADDIPEKRDGRPGPPQRAPEGTLVLQPEHQQQPAEQNTVAQKLLGQKFGDAQGGVDVKQRHPGLHHRPTDQHAGNHQAGKKKQIGVTPEGVTLRFRRGRRRLRLRSGCSSIKNPFR